MNHGAFLNVSHAGSHDVLFFSVKPLLVSASKFSIRSTVLWVTLITFSFIITLVSVLVLLVNVYASYVHFGYVVRDSLHRKKALAPSSTP